ncbi:hypothetical protein E6P09_16910 (plasmid) [Haloferax mediterranei ATCC 33500]|uniref:Uncharacterized protein n=1 Tax=Haloferax mediterranei (strain ATCC 33500 / DSM 1411 / JCM 8866 / NBRC 14739 / NCIMB 2177 / R-4) TaxID=523841 RepID=I3RAQ1_HALMT|nr:hypothetical protein [Haloferax mediterranei]AFK21311.1 hypothetical protein HFX_6187 [Haloferax mediterranei ATCC 33500]AHZ24595.1 hypothetical protein BM92_16995 [Haloferax mediterranei ATCC 33500]ELZ97358.1 hypothetical protein C439_18588 [Haloferax mediterranei ATCC 33500]MDX5990346.1 hypothetical protein [Haloferax mediterranei ATCC 33500]QCQ76992.1 hypothetical protein E6P09_16910 [Haloferax mediterranei ATCC 33500]
MEFAIWAYPWDLSEEGPDRVTARLTELGIDELNLATNYHTVQAFSPHNPERRTFFARASSYFQPDDGYGRLEPVPYEGMSGDWIDEIAAGLGDIRLNSWTVGCHNSRLGMRHPDVTLTSAHGDDLVFGLCPSNPDVQHYLTALVRDLAAREHFDRIELETFDYFYGTGFGWHHQKIHAQLGTLGEFLLGLCFCDHCRSTAADAGLDVEQVRRTVAETLDAVVAGTIPDDLSPERWLREHDVVADYVDIREETLADLYAELSASSGSTPLGYYVGAPEPGREWMVGANLDQLSEHVDYYCLPAYESSRNAVMDAYRTVDALTPDVPLHVGLLPGHPAIHDEATLVEIVDALRVAGVPRVSFYNYGLLPEHSLDWIRAATDTATL